MSAKYASYFNIGINSALTGLGVTLVTLTLINAATHLLPIYGINGKKVIEENRGIGDD